MAWLDRRPDGMTPDPVTATLKINADPEAIFQEGWLLCDVGEYERGLAYVRRAVARGYFAAATLGRPQFDAIRDRPEFQDVVAQAEQGRRQALEAFTEAGGPRLLGG